MRFWTWVFAAAALCGCVLIHGTALACSCAPPPRDRGVLMPKQGERVPRNARFWLAGDAPNASLRAPDGKPIAFVRRTIAVELGPSITILEPDAPLAPGTGFSVQADASSDAVSFDVQDSMDSTAPKPPALIDVEPNVSSDPGNSCGEYRGASLSLDSEGITLVSMASERDTLDREPLAGSAMDMAVPGPRGTFFAYGGPCSAAWPGDEVLELRFASFDIAGNYSGRSEPVSVDRPKQAAAPSCSGVPGRFGRGIGPLWIVALLLALRRLLRFTIAPERR